MFLCWYILYHLRKSNKVNDIKNYIFHEVKEILYLDSKIKDQAISISLGILDILQRKMLLK